MKGDPKAAQSTLEGIYFISSDTTNGKPYWSQEEGPNAIWYAKSFREWTIASAENLGNGGVGIVSDFPDDPVDPLETTIWGYHIGGKFFPSIGNDIVVESGT